MAPLFTGLKFGFGRSAEVAGFSATGGTVTAAGITPGNGYRYHVFTSPGTFTVSGDSLTVEYLVVAGGGGGGKNNHSPYRDGGGGGAGGLLTGSLVTSSGSYSITVGSGGLGGETLTNSSPTPEPENARSSGRRGDSSSFGPTITSTGGGGGFGHTWTGGTGGGTPSLYYPGGSGGGVPGNAEGFPGPTQQGYPGPAGGAGGSGPSPGPAPGGPGLAVPAFAAPLISPEIPSPNTSWVSAIGPTGIYAGGGGWSGPSSNPSGGAGGGGTGGSGFPSSGFTPGVNFTGGGGGGVSGPVSNPYRAGTGGTGIIIIRYLV